MLKKPCVNLLLLTISQSAYGWLDPMAVDVVLNSEDNQFAFYGGPGGQQEWLLNFGNRSSIRIKGHDDPAALKWDLSSYKDKIIEEAELHLCLTAGSVVNSLVVSTINTPWSEGTRTGAAAVTGDSCWRWRSYPDGEWTYKGSDFSTASFGNFGTLVGFGYKHNDTFRQYSSGTNTWVAFFFGSPFIKNMVALSVDSCINNLGFLMESTGFSTNQKRALWIFYSTGRLKWRT